MRRTRARLPSWSRIGVALVAPMGLQPELSKRKRRSTMKAQTLHPEVVLRDGKPVAVILDIEEYRELLERLEDAEDLRELERMRLEGVEYRSLDEFLAEYSPGA